MDYKKKTIDALRQIEGAMRDLQSGPMNWYLDRLSNHIDLLFERFCPFRVGDRVRLEKTPRIDADHAPGWMSSKHFLVVGAMGVIRGRDADRTGFYFDVEFDEESWLNGGKLEPVSSKHTYHFDESYLRKVERACSTYGQPTPESSE